MKIFCLLLGFEIDRELVCRASGINPLYRKCLGQEEAEPVPGNRESRKRCECGRVFFAKSNRQRLCEICGPRAERKRKTEWERKRRKSMSVSGRLEAKNRKEIRIF